MLRIILFSSLFLNLNGASYFDVVQEQWNTFKLTYQKQYTSQIEEDFRLKIYMHNLHQIAIHNQKYEQGLVSFQAAPNKYTDLLHLEFVKMLNGYNRTERLMKEKIHPNVSEGFMFIPPANVDLPDFVDWRKKGAVTPVKDQGACGSCWSFSATGSLEGQHFRKTKKLVSLSEQNLVDCSRRFGNNGCEGGLMDYAFAYIKSNQGLDTEKSYPYRGTDGKCHYNPKNSGATDKGYTDIKSFSEDDLKAAVATVGPICVAIDASGDSFQFYKKGIYNEPDCSSTILDHGVLAVGYGTSKDGVDYWIVKNSWGTSWGQDGYILMSRNKDNQCGIATAASYPVV